MSVKSCNSVGDPSFPHNGAVIRCQYLKKLKTSRKKWFVLRAETPDSSARLEYYDTEKKYNSGQPPKRIIPLKTCFNINKRLDTKHKHVIALYTKDDCFCIVLDNEEDLESWLKALLSLQHGGEEAADGEPPRPTFEHVWQVTVLNKGLGTADIIGNYRLCLTDKTLSLIKKDCNEHTIDLNLSNIRSCGNLKHYFLLEIGRQSSLGAGELWMDTEDSNIAHNIHSTVFHAMSTNSNKDELGPKSRNRSSSATESSKPAAIRKHTHTGVLPKPHIFPGMTGRERCDSMPSRPRTTSEGNHPIPMWSRHHPPIHMRGYHNRDSHSPPSGSPVSPPSAGCSTDSAGSSYSLQDDGDVCTELEPNYGTPRYGPSLTPDEAIAEEDTREDSIDSPCGLSYRTTPLYIPMTGHSSDDGYVDMSPKGRNNAVSPTASMSSVTSGTPSTDIRFTDYSLEKVSCHFTLAEDEESSGSRGRAYSDGSRPKTCQTRRYTDLATTPENFRARAVSWCSRTKKPPSRVLPPHYPHPGAKSSSAPILSNNSRAHSSQGSIGPRDHLMEIDFSSYTSMKSGKKTPNGYVEMKPGIPEVSKSQDISPYVDMRSGSSPAKVSTNVHADDYTTFVDLNKQYKISDTPKNDYMDMDPKKNYKIVSVKPSTSPSTTLYSDYLDMTIHSKRPERNSFSSDLSTSPVKSTKLIDTVTSFFNNKSIENPSQTTPDGYVEMSLGKHHRQSSLDSAQINVNNRGNADDYTNMTMGSWSKQRKERRSSKKDKPGRSQPITIQATGNGSQAIPKNSCSPNSIGRSSYTTGTPPKLHLPLVSCANSSYSSLPRQRSRKNSRRDSKDSSSSSVTTPSSSSTIFPISLNSPSSPMKTTKIDASTKKPSSMPTFYNKLTKSNSEDYAVMDFDKKNKAEPEDDSEYVNYNPASRNVTSSAEIEDNFSAVLTLEKEVVKPSVKCGGVVARSENAEFCIMGFKPINEKDSSSNSSPKGSSLQLSECSNNERITRPNSVNSDKVIKTNSCVSAPGEKPRPSSVGSERSRSPASCDTCSSNSTLVGSVNSDNAWSGVSSEGQVLHYVDLDLAQTEDECNSRSPRTNNRITTNDTTSSNVPNTSEQSFFYAKIDFGRSESLKHNSLPSNARVKH